MTNIILWGLAGGTAGWIGYSFLKWNEGRGLATSIVIGMFGGLLGGKLLSPMIGSGSAVSSADFNPFSLFVALASAAAVLIFSNMIQKRFGL